MTVHGFRDQLRWSQEAGDEPFWEKVYRKAFPDFLNMMDSLEDNEAQRRGIDRVILLKSGRLLRIDEKKRKKERPDILLEYTSNDVTGSPGWIEKEQEIDYIAYAFMETQKVYLLPWKRLRKAWLMNRAQWFFFAEERQHGFGCWAAQNTEYQTWSMAVPIPVLLKAIERAALQLWPIICVRL